MDNPALNNILIALVVGFVTILISLFVLLLSRLRDLLPRRREIPIVDDTHLLIIRRDDGAGDLLKVSLSLYILVNTVLILTFIGVACLAILMSLLAGMGLLGVLKSLIP